MYSFCIIYHWFSVVDFLILGYYIACTIKKLCASPEYSLWGWDIYKSRRHHPIHEKLSFILHAMNNTNVSSFIDPTFNQKHHLYACFLEQQIPNYHFSSASDKNSEKSRDDYKTFSISLFIVISKLLSLNIWNHNSLNLISAAIKTLSYFSQACQQCKLYKRIYIKSWVDLHWEGVIMYLNMKINNICW